MSLRNEGHCNQFNIGDELENVRNTSLFLEGVAGKALGCAPKILHPETLNERSFRPTSLHHEDMFVTTDWKEVHTMCIFSVF